MELKIELDAERVHREVVEKLVAHFIYELKNEVTTTLRKNILVGVREKVEELTQAFLDTEVFPDGRMFVEHVREMLQKKAQHSERPRIMETVEAGAYNAAMDIFKKELLTHHEAFKKKLVETLLSFIRVDA